MKITGLKGKIKGAGTYIALAVCMVGIGACGWLTIGRNINDDTPASGDTYSLITDATPSYNDTVNVGGTVSGIITADDASDMPQSSEETPSQENSTSIEAEPVQNTVADYFVLPLTGEILKPFSLKEMQYSETFADWRLHNAIDIAGEKNTIIHSAGDGTVLDIYDDAQYGKVVKIDHGNNTTSVYCGLGSVYVKKGEAVGVNQDIGVLGEIPCESADKSHLHFAVIKDGAYISPLEVMNME